MVSLRQCSPTSTRKLTWAAVSSWCTGPQQLWLGNISCCAGSANQPKQKLLAGPFLACCLSSVAGSSAQPTCRASSVYCTANHQSSRKGRGAARLAHRWLCATAVRCTTRQCPASCCQPLPVVADSQTCVTCLQSWVWLGTVQGIPAVLLEWYTYSMVWPCSTTVTALRLGCCTSSSCCCSWLQQFWPLPIIVLKPVGREILLTIN
jgi:hypothetical protein